MLIYIYQHGQQDILDALKIRKAEKRRYCDLKKAENLFNIDDYSDKPRVHTRLGNGKDYDSTPKAFYTYRHDTQFYPLKI